MNKNIKQRNTEVMKSNSCEVPPFPLGLKFEQKLLLLKPLHISTISTASAPKAFHEKHFIDINPIFTSMWKVNLEKLYLNKVNIRIQTGLYCVKAE